MYVSVTCIEKDMAWPVTVTTLTATLGVLALVLVMRYLYSLASFVNLCQVDVVMSAQVLTECLSFQTSLCLLICVCGKWKLIGEYVL
jgi:hypothetical protein